jgi:hypothetical protein
MGQPFPNEVAGGNGTLLIPAIQSPNFSQSAQTGWAIMQNGDAYFYNITAEGTITATTLVASGSGGVFVYSGTPGPGNPPIVAATSAAADPFGNAIYGALQIGIGLAAGGGMVVSAEGDVSIANTAGTQVVYWYHGDGSLRFYDSTGVAAGHLKVAISPAAGLDGAGNT